MKNPLVITARTGEKDLEFVQRLRRGILHANKTCLDPEVCYRLYACLGFRQRYPLYARHLSQQQLNNIRCAGLELEQRPGEVSIHFVGRVASYFQQKSLTCDLCFAFIVVRGLRDKVWQKAKKHFLFEDQRGIKQLLAGAFDFYVREATDLELARNIIFDFAETLTSTLQQKVDQELQLAKQKCEECECETPEAGKCEQVTPVEVVELERETPEASERETSEEVIELERKTPEAAEKRKREQPEYSQGKRQVKRKRIEKQCVGCCVH